MVLDCDGSIGVHEEKPTSTTWSVPFSFYTYRTPLNVNIYPGQIHKKGRMWAKQDARRKISWSIKCCVVGRWKLPSGTSAS